MTDAGEPKECCKAASWETVISILGAIDRLAESQRKELNGNPLTDGRYQGIRKSAEIIRLALYGLGGANQGGAKITKNADRILTHDNATYSGAAPTYDQLANDSRYKRIHISEGCCEFALDGTRYVCVLQQSAIKVGGVAAGRWTMVREYRKEAKSA